MFAPEPTPKLFSSQNGICLRAIGEPEQSEVGAQTGRTWSVKLQNSVLDLKGLSQVTGGKSVLSSAALHMERSDSAVSCSKSSRERDTWNNAAADSSAAASFWKGCHNLMEKTSAVLTMCDQKSGDSTSACFRFLCSVGVQCLRSSFTAVFFSHMQILSDVPEDRWHRSQTSLELPEQVYPAGSLVCVCMCVGVCVCVLTQTHFCNLCRGLCGGFRTPFAVFAISNCCFLLFLITHL